MKRKRGPRIPKGFFTARQMGEYLEISTKTAQRHLDSFACDSCVRWAGKDIALWRKSRFLDLVKAIGKGIDWHRVASRDSYGN